MIQELLIYYDENKRQLPWRKNRDPYRIWVSEIMCQQTRVETVIDYFNRFMQDYPTITDLANTSLDELNKHWQGLGYYSRARNLLKAAQLIVKNHAGKFPDNYQDIIQLPGIGQYTASAICSMAYDLPYVSIDGNFFRVFSRFYKWDFDISLPTSKQLLTEKLKPLIPKRSGDFNQAVMDLGATICLSYDQPKCDKCPLRQECLAHKDHVESDYPISSKNTKIKTFSYSVFLIKVKDQFVIHKRKDTGLLASLYEFKNENNNYNLEQVKKMFETNNVIQYEKATHHFSHQTWIMQPYLIELTNYDLKENEYLVSKEEILQKYSIPTCFNQFFNLLNI